MKSFRVVICLLSLVWAFAACSGEGSRVNSDREVHPSRNPSSHVSNDALPLHKGPAINLKCSAGNTVPLPSDASLRGLGTDFFGWQSGTWRGANLKDVPTITLWGRNFYQVKSPISVHAGASARTQISLLSPTSGRLYFTDWATWAKLGSDPKQSSLIARNSTSVVSVPQCGQQGWTVPGMLLLEGPTCLSFRVTGQEPGFEVALTVPFYRERC